MNRKAEKSLNFLRDKTSEALLDGKGVLSKFECQEVHKLYKWVDLIDWELRQVKDESLADWEEIYNETANLPYRMRQTISNTLDNYINKQYYKFKK